MVTRAPKGADQARQGEGPSEQRASGHSALRIFGAGYALVLDKMAKTIGRTAKLP
jgi:hypothetical protein